MLHLSVRPFFLRFTHPFGTAHGVREGTDSVFVRLAQHGQVGYGEATLPPYVGETTASVLEELRALDLAALTLPADLHLLLARTEPLVHRAPSARAAITMAAMDLAGRLAKLPVWWLMEYPRPAPIPAMMTLGLCEDAAVADRIAELPPCNILKVKLNGRGDESRLASVRAAWSQALFLDVNQGWPSGGEPTWLMALIKNHKVLGIEQPYTKDDLDSHQRLSRSLAAAVYADESIQGLSDLRSAAASFGGVNVKLQKCGGLDEGHRIAHEARAYGKKVMLGSMSESSLGCTAAAHLASCADLADLDGPWLLENDPFTGLELADGELVVPDLPGLGVELRAELEFDPIGA